MRFEKLARNFLVAWSLTQALSLTWSLTATNLVVDGDGFGYVTSLK